MHPVRQNSLDSFLLGMVSLRWCLSVSAVQQSESAIRTHSSPLCWISVPCRSPRSTEFSELYAGSHASSALHARQQRVNVSPSLPAHAAPLVSVFALFVCELPVFSASALIALRKDFSSCRLLLRWPCRIILVLPLRTQPSPTWPPMQ